MMPVAGNYFDVQEGCYPVDSELSNSKGGLGTFNKWFRKGAVERTVYADTEKLVDVPQQTGLIEDVGPEEKLRQRKLRLQEVSANFDESMDRLNDELVSVRDV
jgi:hypothetical protein